MTRNRPTFLSLNRFEKKDINLAIFVFTQFRQGLTAADKNTRKLGTARIVIGGGYDPRMKDHIDTLDELVSLTEYLTIGTPQLCDPPRHRGLGTRRDA